MSLYQTLVLLHVVATGGLFAGLGIEVAALRRMQRAATAVEARVWLPSLKQPGGMLPHVSMAALVLTGLGRAAQRGSLNWSTWLRVGLYLGVLGLMALKPGVVGSVAILAISDGAGATASVALSRDQQAADAARYVLTQ